MTDNAAPTPRRILVAAAVIFIVLPLLGGALLAEIGIRIWKREIAFQPDPELIRSLRPNVEQPIYSFETFDNLNGVTDTIPDKPQHIGIAHSNNLGFRMKADVTGKAPGEIRIVILGDSYAEASETPESERFSHLSERQLNLRPGAGKTYRVVNMGIMNGSPSQYILMLRKYLEEVNPDIVIVVLGANDYSDDRMHQRLYGFVLDGEGYPVGLKATRQLWLLQKSYLLRYIHVALATRAPALQEAFFPPAEPEVDAPDWQNLLCRNSPQSRAEYVHWTGRYLLRIRDMVEARGARFGVLPIHYAISFSNEPYYRPRFPDFEQSIASYGCNEASAHQYNLFVTGLLAANGIAFVDLLEPLLDAKREAPKRKLWNFYDYHFSGAGHRVVGSQLVKLVELVESRRR